MLRSALLLAAMTAVGTACGLAQADLAAPAGRWLAYCLVGMLLSMWAGTAQSVPALSAPIPPQPLAQALVEFAHQTGLQLLYESKLAVQRHSNEAAQGLSAAAALTEMLRGTGLDFQFLNPKTVRIYEPAAVAPAVQPSASDIPNPRAEPAVPRVDALEEVIVTATLRAERADDVPISMEVW